MTAPTVLTGSSAARLGALDPDPHGGAPPLVSANQLRGFVAQATATPVQPGPIPFSLDRHRTGAFMLARGLRIYPTDLAALLIKVLTLHADGWFWGRPFPYNTRMVVMNALLIHGLVTSAPSIDLVNWTLCIELKFYLLLALLAQARATGLPIGYGAGLMCRPCCCTTIMAERCSLCCRARISTRPAPFGRPPGLSLLLALVVAGDRLPAASAGREAVNCRRTLPCEDLSKES